MWGSIISGGLNLLGGLAGSGLFGGGSSAEGGGAKKAKHHALDYDRRRIKAIVDGAGDAGIHPLVALGAQGGGSFAAPVVDGAGFGDAVSRGLGVLGDTISDYYEQDQDRQDREYQRSLDDDARFDKIIQDQLQSKRDDQAFRESEARIAEHMANAKAANARAAAVGAAPTTTRLIGPGTAVSLSDGSQWPKRPGAISAQDAEDYGGEIAEFVQGGDNMLWSFLQAAKEGKIPGLPNTWEKFIWGPKGKPGWYKGSVLENILE